MTTDTDNSALGIRELRDTMLTLLSGALDAVAETLRSLRQEIADGDGSSRRQARSASDIADERIRRLDAAVSRGDVSAEDVRDLRSGYERVRAREQGGLPPLDLTY